MNKNAKPGKVATNPGSNQNIFTGGKFNGFDVVNLTINEEKLQSDLMMHLRRHRKVRKLARCLGCNQPKSPLRFSAHSAICRDCVKYLKEKGATAQSNFIERAKANVGRFLKGVVANYA